MGNDFFEDGAKSFMDSNLSSIIGTLFLSGSVFWMSRPSPSATAICPSFESYSWVFALQCLGVVLDAAVLVVTWRILQWARTTTERFMNLGWILITPAFFITFFAYASSLWGQHTWTPSHLLGTNGIGFHFWTHIILQSGIFLFIASTLFAQHHSPLASATIITFVCGGYAAWERLYLIGTFVYVSRAQALLGLCLLTLGYNMLAFREHIRHIYFRRPVILIFLVSCILGSSIYSLIVTGVLSRHPVDMLVYSSRTNGARWLVQDAKVSKSLVVATREYKERHGRDPPPKFDVWYEFATARHSEVIDSFRQIDDDLRPFWSVKPREIQDSIAKLVSSPGIVVLSIKNGVVESQSSLEPQDEIVMNDLVQLIQTFSQHLPDMDLPVNLLDLPRVVAPSSDTARTSQVDLKEHAALSPRQHQHQLGRACPASSKARFGFYAESRDFCWSCAKPHSLQQFIMNADEDRDLCHQPDMLNLHGFYISGQTMKPFTDLMPVFSRTKTNQHSDILIPLSRGSDDYASPAEEKALLDKTNILHWRGSVKAEETLPEGLLSGGHQQRLSYLVNNASDKSSITVLLAKDGDKDRFLYESISLDQANRKLGFDVGIGDYSACVAPGCDVMKQEFGSKSADQTDNERLNNRYVLVMDSDEGPPKDFIKVLRSTSVPFLASIFKVRNKLAPMSTTQQTR